jgi:hypothetical protein
MCLIISRSISKLAATFATKWVNTKLDYVPENKISKNELDARENESYT